MYISIFGGSPLQNYLMFEELNDIVMFHGTINRHMSPKHAYSKALISAMKARETTNLCVWAKKMKLFRILLKLEAGKYWKSTLSSGQSNHRRSSHKN